MHGKLLWANQLLLLGLHYVPGSHGSHVSQKRSSPWCFSHFLSLCSSSVKSRYVFSRSVKVCRDRGSPACYGLSRMVLRFLPACHVLLGPLPFLLRCDQVLLRLSSSVKVFSDEMLAMNGV